MDDTDRAKKADEYFEEIVQYCRSAAMCDNAAGYNVAINGLKWVASVLNPEKYGNKVTGPASAEGFTIETGIRREGDAGFIPASQLPHFDQGLHSVQSSDGTISARELGNDADLIE